MSIRRIILSLSAVALVLLGLEKVGVFHFLPEGDTHFEVEVLQSPTRLSLHTDVGDLKGWVRLIVLTPTDEDLALSAVDWRGEVIGVGARRIQDHLFEISVNKDPPGAAGPAFDWPPGVELELKVDNALSGPIVVEDWAVYNNKQEADTLAKAQQRRWWTRVSWALLALSLVGTVVTGLGEKEASKTVSPSAELIRNIIESIEGNSPKETKRIRRFLTQVVLLETPINEALQSAGFKMTEIRKWGAFQARAASLFKERADKVRLSLDQAVASVVP